MNKLWLLTVALLLTSVSVFAQTAEPKRYPYMQMVSGNSHFAWKVTKDSWDENDEVQFGEFVQKIGLAAEKKECRSFNACLSNPSINPLYSANDEGIRYFADCADVPYWLRTYFAWKKGLPMSISVNTQPRDPNDPKGANRNSTVSGNMVIMRADSIASSNRFPDITQFLSSTSKHGLILDSISSGTLRTPVIPDPIEPAADFYPIAINRASIKPGTVIYTADGHVAIVYKVDLDGNIRTLNGHPADPNAAQSPLSVRDYNDTFKRSRQEHGSIFKNFRPVEVVGAQRDAQGNLIGGRIRFKTNSELPLASDQQATRKFGSTDEYFMFVRRNMASGALKMDVVTEFKRSLKNLCDTVQGRVELVDQAIKAGMDQKTLAVGPNNIFSDHGDWENYSTPSRDVNIRVLFKKALDDLKTSVTGLRSGDKIYVYTGSQLATDLKQVYDQKATNCTVTFTSRAGVVKTLNLKQIRERIFKISFDPYQYSDLRWGDTEEGKRMCTEDVRWYNSQQYLRNLTEKNSDNHAMTVEQMEAQNQAKNKPVIWNTDIEGYITSLSGPTAAVPRR